MIVKKRSRGHPGNGTLIEQRKEERDSREDDDELESEKNSATSTSNANSTMARDIANVSMIKEDNHVPAAAKS